MAELLEQHGHESTDAGIRPIVFAMAALAVVMAIIGLVSFGIFEYLRKNASAIPRPNPMAIGPVQRPPDPVVQEHPALELQQLRAQEDQTLTTYGWVDKQAGIVRIPIDKAMDLALQQGFPTRKGAAPK